MLAAAMNKKEVVEAPLTSGVKIDAQDDTGGQP